MLNIFSGQPTIHKLGFDRVTAILAVSVGIAFVAWSISLKNYRIETPGILLVSSLLYLLLRKRLSTSEGLPQFQLGNRIGLLSHIIFVISLFLSVWLLWSNLYYRPPVYFILCLVAAACIILNIFGLDETKRLHTAIVLFQIIAVSVTIYAGIYYQFPGIYGVDPWGHNRLIQETANLGRIVEGMSVGGDFIENSYFLFPMFHLAGTITQIVTQISTYSSIFITVGVLISLSCLFVFLIGRELINTKVGLLAALIVALNADTIEIGTGIIPMSLGFCFFLTILYLVLRRDRKKFSDSLLLMLLSVAVILTHTLAAVVTLVAMISIFTVTRVNKEIGKRSISYEPVSLTFIAFFGVAMLVRWMQTPPGTPTFFDLRFEGFISALKLGTQLALAEPLAATGVSYPVSLFDKSGSLLVLAFAIIGSLAHLCSKNRTGPKTALISTAVALLLVPYAFQLFSLWNILPYRWFLFSHVPLSVLAISGLSSVSNLIKGNAAKLGMVMLVILVVLFMMTTNSVANDESPMIFNGARRYGYTRAEITTISTLSDMGCGCPVTDRYYGVILPEVIGYAPYVDMVLRENKVFILRNYYLHHPEWNQWYVETIHLGGFGKYEPRPALISDYMKEHAIDNEPLIYGNGNTKVYAITSAE